MNNILQFYASDVFLLALLMLHSVALFFRLDPVAKNA